MQKLKGAIMNNLETNALRIIGLLYPDIDINGIEKYKQFFSSYEGLMPIVCECNGVFASNVSHEIEISRYFVRIHIADLNQSAEVVPEIYSYSFDYTTEPEFIEALQLACIKYLEIKNDNSRVQQTI